MRVTMKQNDACVTVGELRQLRRWHEAIWQALYRAHTQRRKERAEAALADLDHWLQDMGA